MHVVSAEEAEGTLSIQWCKQDDRILDGMHWKIYKVGIRDGDDFKLQGDFAKYPVTFGKRDENANTWDASILKSAASMLWSYAFVDQIPYLDEGWTDAQRYLEFQWFRGRFVSCLW